MTVIIHFELTYLGFIIVLKHYRKNLSFFCFVFQFFNKGSQLTTHLFWTFEKRKTKQRYDRLFKKQSFKIISRMSFVVSIFLVLVKNIFFMFSDPRVFRSKMYFVWKMSLIIINYWNDRQRSSKIKIRQIPSLTKWKPKT